MKKEQARVYLPQVSPEVAEQVETGYLKPCIFDLIDGLCTKDYADKAKSLPRFELVAWPQEIPPDLLALPSDSEVIFRRGGSDKVETVGLVLDCFKSKMERQSKGFFELSESAEILSNSICDEWGERMPKEKMWAEMKDAFLTGVLTFYDEYKQPLDLAKLRRMNDPRTVLYAPDYNMLGMYGETTTPQAINQWLEGMGSPHRFPEPVETPAQPVAAVPAPQASPEPVRAAPAMKRSALIAEYLNEWPSIEADLNDASRNELDSAKLPKHGMWDADKALAWARSRGKLVQQRTSMEPATWHGATTRHQLR